MSRRWRCYSCLFLMSRCFFGTNAVLDTYIPAQRERKNIDCDQLIENYYYLGFQQEIVTFFTLMHGFTLSIRHLNGFYKKRSLRRRQNHADLGLIIGAIEQEIEGSGSCIGYRVMWQQLGNDHFSVSRETIRQALKIIDPE